VKAMGDSHARKSARRSDFGVKVLSFYVLGRPLHVLDLFCVT
jgi:hypothetical protein